MLVLLPVVILVEGGELEPVEVGQEVLDLVGPVDVGDGVHPVSRGRRARGNVRCHGKAAQAPLPNAGPTNKTQKW